MVTGLNRTHRVGEGNGNFLHDLERGVSDEIMRVRFTDGYYHPIHRPSIAGWRRLAGRTSTRGNG